MGRKGKVGMRQKGVVHKEPIFHSMGFQGYDQANIKTIVVGPRICTMIKEHYHVDVVSHCNDIIIFPLISINPIILLLKS